MSLEFWAGPECTVNRVQDHYFDQLERSGHAHRVEDLERFAALGIRAIRYPVLWERTAPESLDRPDWAWADARLSRIRDLGITMKGQDGQGNLALQQSAINTARNGTDFLMDPPDGATSPG